MSRDLQAEEDLKREQLAATVNELLKMRAFTKDMQTHEIPWDENTNCDVITYQGCVVALFTVDYFPTATDRRIVAALQRDVNKLECKIIYPQGIYLNPELPAVHIFNEVLAIRFMALQLRLFMSGKSIKEWPFVQAELDRLSKSIDTPEFRKLLEICAEAYVTRVNRSVPAPAAAAVSSDKKETAQSKPSPAALKQSMVVLNNIINNPPRDIDKAIEAINQAIDHCENNRDTEPKPTHADADEYDMLINRANALKISLLTEPHAEKKNSEKKNKPPVAQNNSVKKMIEDLQARIKNTDAIEATHALINKLKNLIRCGQFPAAQKQKEALSKSQNSLEKQKTELENRIQSLAQLNHPTSNAARNRVSQIAGMLSEIKSIQDGLANHEANLKAIAEEKAKAEAEKQAKVKAAEKEKAKIEAALAAVQLAVQNSRLDLKECIKKAEDVLAHYVGEIDLSFLQTLYTSEKELDAIKKKLKNYNLPELDADIAEAASMLNKIQVCIYQTSFQLKRFRHDPYRCHGRVGVGLFSRPSAVETKSRPVARVRSDYRGTAIFMGLPYTNPSPQVGASTSTVLYVSPSPIIGLKR